MLAGPSLAGHLDPVTGPRSLSATRRCGRSLSTTTHGVIVGFPRYCGIGKFFASDGCERALGGGSHLRPPMPPVPAMTSPVSGWTHTFGFTLTLWKFWVMSFQTNACRGGLDVLAHPHAIVPVAVYPDISNVYVLGVDRDQRSLRGAAAGIGHGMLRGQAVGVAPGVDAGVAVKAGEVASGRDREEDRRVGRVDGDDLVVRSPPGTCRPT